ncbi:unnamed protein product [Lasius platythorax]|uniref:Uncharacterized protein n=1 Tax=Lasius platythorax TaxID=488582 RepID=A0AAV2PA79_9HYME
MRCDEARSKDEESARVVGNKNNRGDLAFEQKNVFLMSTTMMVTPRHGVKPIAMVAIATAAFFRCCRRRSLLFPPFHEAGFH